MMDMKKVEQIEYEAFEAYVEDVAGAGALQLWIKDNPNSGYANERVNDERRGWVACLEWLATLSKQDGNEVAHPGPDKRQRDVCTCPSGDGSLRWPCPTHRPAPAQDANEFNTSDSDLTELLNIAVDMVKGVGGGMDLGIYFMTILERVEGRLAARPAQTKKDELELAYLLGDVARRAWLEHGGNSWVTIGKAIVAELRKCCPAQSAPQPEQINIDALLNAGAALSNIAFNLAQRPGVTLDQHVCDLLSSARKSWDAACAALFTKEATPEERSAWIDANVSGSPEQQPVARTSLPDEIHQMAFEELKPCPFCGGANLSIVPYGLERDDEQPADRPHAVSCEDCGSLGAEIAPRGAAVAAWNRRAQPAEAEGVDWDAITEEVKHAYHERKSITEAVDAICAALSTQGNNT